VFSYPAPPYATPTTTNESLRLVGGSSAPRAGPHGPSRPPTSRRDSLGCFLHTNPGLIAPPAPFHPFHPPTPALPRSPPLRRPHDPQRVSLTRWGLFLPSYDDHHPQRVSKTRWGLFFPSYPEANPSFAPTSTTQPPTSLFDSLGAFPPLMRRSPPPTSRYDSLVGLPRATSLLRHPTGLIDSLGGFPRPTTL
jgi:hypothetical protein